MLVFEYAGGGDLKEYLESRKLSAQGPLTEREACDIFGKIVNAVSYCHKKNIVHRDLKLANILIQEQPKPQRRSRSSSSSGSTGSSSSSSSSSGSTSTSSSSSSVADDTAHRSRSAGDHLNGANVAAGIKVADFGLSSIYSPGREASCRAGSLAYMAPEVLTASEFLEPPCDVWSLGIILFALLCGRLPFSGKSYGEVEKNVISGSLSSLPEEKGRLSSEARGLVNRILRKNPAERIGLGQISTHPWMEKYAQYTVRRNSRIKSIFGKTESKLNQSGTTLNPGSGHGGRAKPIEIQAKSKPDNGGSGGIQTGRTRNYTPLRPRW